MRDCFCLTCVLLPHACFFRNTCVLLLHACSFATHAFATDMFYLTHSRFLATLAFSCHARLLLPHMRSFATRISFCHTCVLLPQACSFAAHARSFATDVFYLTHSRFSATLAFNLQHTVIFWPMLATPLHFSPIQDFPSIPCRATKHFSTLHLRSSICPTTTMIHHCRHSVDGSKLIPFLDLTQVLTMMKYRFSCQSLVLYSSGTRGNVWRCDCRRCCQRSQGNWVVSQHAHSISVLCFLVS